MRLLVISLVLIGVASAQDKTDTEKQEIVPISLHVTKKFKVENEMAPLTLRPYFCDGNDHVYYRKYIVGTTFRAPIEKVEQKSARVIGTFKLPPAPKGNEFNARDFFVSTDGTVTALAWIPATTQVYMVRFNSAGEPGNATKLEGDFQPEGPIAVFPSGDVLVTGFEANLAEPRSRLFSAIFSSDGKLVKRVEFPSDRKVETMAKQHDPSVSPTLAPQLNLAVSDGRILVGADGNAYLMRPLNPPEIYVVNSTGEVIRTFVVKTNSNLPVSTMVEHDGKIGLLFKERQMKGPSRIEMVDASTGEPIASYDGDEHLGAALACYNGEYFTYLGAEQQMLTIQHLAP
jgi:hypothetical protein